jgi:hypothetical protein
MIEKLKKVVHERRVYRDGLKYSEKVNGISSSPFLSSGLASGGGGAIRN